MVAHIATFCSRCPCGVLIGAMFARKRACAASLSKLGSICHPGRLIGGTPGGGGITAAPAPAPAPTTIGATAGAPIRHVLANGIQARPHGLDLIGLQFGKITGPPGAPGAPGGSGAFLHVHAFRIQARPHGFDIPCRQLGIV